MPSPSTDLVALSPAPQRGSAFSVAQMRSVYRCDEVERRLQKLPPKEHEHLRGTYERMLEKGPERFQVKPSGLPAMEHLYDELPNFHEALDDIRRILASREALYARADADRRTSGTGGFALYGEASLALHHDLNTPAGREQLDALRDEELRKGHQPGFVGNGNQRACDHGVSKLVSGLYSGISRCSKLRMAPLSPALALASNAEKAARISIRSSVRAWARRMDW